MTLNLEAQSNRSDSTTVSTVALKRILTAAQQKNVLQEQVSILNDRIKNYQDIITNLNEKDSATVEGFNLQIQTMNQEKIIYEDQIKTLEKMLKKEQRKRKLTAFGGVALTGIVTYLYIIK